MELQVVTAGRDRRSSLEAGSLPGGSTPVARCRPHGFAIRPSAAGWHDTGEQSRRST